MNSILINAHPRICSNYCPPSFQAMEQQQQVDMVLKIMVNLAKELLTLLVQIAATTLASRLGVAANNR